MWSLGLIKIIREMNAECISIDSRRLASKLLKLEIGQI